MTMHADNSIYFRDPFAYDTRLRGYWHSQPPYADLARALTPPPESMNETYQTSKSGYYQQEHRHHYGDHMPSQQSYKAPVAPHLPQDLYTSNHARNGIATQPNSRTMSPVFQSRHTTVDDSQIQQSHRRRESQGLIAESFQIPKSVNDSGGSLSELASQITCLFWFEESELLQRVEDSKTSIFPTRRLITDAKPSTGFRKWVTTILSTTLVAQNVVLLALLFIYRLKKLNPTVQGKPGSEYRLLTVALMLGNKFLDDNTYTNKTWSEVSGISVTEVHIMEVEFLSNMKYCLFTSADDWSKWQTLLGKFATFFERASKPQPPAPILPPASSLHLPMALPSPPASNQASPPYMQDAGQAYAAAAQNGPTPAPSPLAFMSASHASPQNARKRSLDDYAAEPPPKRIASGFQTYQSPLHYASGPLNGSQSQRLPLPSLPLPTGQTSTAYAQSTSQPQQLPPLKMPARAMAMVYPNTSSEAQIQQIAALAGPSSQPQSQSQSQYQSRQQSPYQRSTSVSPNAMPTSVTTSHPPAQVSPTYFLQQRNSPYRPVHNVSTLLYPPPTSALQNRPGSIEYNQMHYQPLGKPIQHRQSGRLPYVSQNVWVDGNLPGHMTPVHHWPSFMNTQQQQLIAQQSN